MTDPIDLYEFSPLMLERFGREYNKSKAETQVIFDCLKTYFRAIKDCDGPVAMPSATVDDAWHMFLIYTHDYAEFSNTFFGKFLHHVPDGKGGDNSASMKRIWDFCCKDLNQDPSNPDIIPTMFFLDSYFLHSKGFKYDFKRVKSQMNVNTHSKYYFLYLMLKQLGYSQCFDHSPYSVEG